MFSTSPSTGTCTRSNIRTPRRASISAMSCGVETITAPVSATRCAMVSCASPVPGGMSTTSTSSGPHVHLAHHLLQRAHHHRAAPDHRRLLLDQEADRHAGQAPGLQRDHLVAPHLRLAVQAQHARQARAVDVGVQQPDLVALLRQRHREVHRHGGFADAALAGGHRDDRLHLRQQQRRLLPVAAVAGRVAMPPCLRWPPARPPVRPPPAARRGTRPCARSAPRWRWSPPAGAPAAPRPRARTGSIAAACARSVSSDTCTRPPRSSIPSTRPAATMSRPVAGSVIARNASRKASCGGGHGAILLLRPGNPDRDVLANLAPVADKQPAVTPRAIRYGADAVPPTPVSGARPAQELRQSCHEQWRPHWSMAARVPGGSLRVVPATAPAGGAPPRRRRSLGRRAGRPVARAVPAADGPAARADARPR